MKKIGILSVLMIALVLGGCTQEQPAAPTLSPSPAASPSPAVTQTPQRPERKIEKNQADDIPAGWTTLGETEYDVTSDGDPDQITLKTSAAREDGELYLDDSQEWALTVETDQGVYPLYREHTHGTPYLEVSEFYIGEETVPVIALYIFSGAGTELRQYRWRDGAFYETVAYTTNDEADGGINRIYSSIPDYI